MSITINHLINLLIAASADGISMISGNIQEISGYSISGLISESILHAKPCQRLLICLKNSPYFEFTIETLMYFVYFVNDRKELLYAGLNRSEI